MREKRRVQRLEAGAFIGAHADRAAGQEQDVGHLGVPAAPSTLTCPTSAPMPAAKATSHISGSAMLPTRLGMASLRHTSRLRKNTGHQRAGINGGRQDREPVRVGGGARALGGNYSMGLMCAACGKEPVDALLREAQQVLRLAQRSKAWPTLGSATPP